MRRIVFCALLLLCIPVGATGQVGRACGGHNAVLIGGFPGRINLDPDRLRRHGPPTLPIPGMTAGDRVLWDALVFDAYDYPTADETAQAHWRRALPLEERHTIVMPESAAASFQVCIQSSDESYTGERLTPYTDRDWWQSQVQYFTNHRWSGSIEVDVCDAVDLESVPNGWVYVREGRPGEVDDDYLAQATSWYYFDPHGTVSRWVKSEIVWHSAEKVRGTDERWLESSLAHELGHVLGFSHVDPSSGFVMLHDGPDRVWPEAERRLARLAYRVGPGIEYPGFVPVSGSNRPPTAVGTLPDRELPLSGTLTIDVSPTFVDPDGDALTYTVSSSALQVVAARAVDARVTLTAVGEGAATVLVTATDPGGLSASQAFTATVDRAANRPPAAVGTLSDVRLPEPEATREVEMSRAFVDPDGDPLTYTVSSSAPDVVTVRSAVARLTLTAVSAGTATIQVTATDPGGRSATQSFTVTVGAPVRVPFTDDPIVLGVTPIKAVHFTELRTRIDALRSAAGLPRFSWTDPVLRPGVTRVRRVHLLELREALAAAYAVAGRAVPRWTDASAAAGSTPIRAAHLTELRAAVLALE